MFPGLFDLLNQQRHADEVHRVINSYAKASLVKLADYPDFLARCLARSGRASDRIAVALRRERSAQANERNDERREVDAVASELQALLDLAPLFDSPSCDQMLRKALDLEVPFFQTQAAAALLGQNEPVDPQLLDSLVQRPDLRAALWDALYKADKLAAFPSDYCNQQALAEAEMVKWLQFPTEMGRPPEEAAPFLVLLDIIPAPFLGFRHIRESPHHSVAAREK